MRQPGDMRRFRIWASVVLVAAAVLVCVWAVWNFELRWRPRTIGRHQTEIATLLKEAGWVSPGKPGRRLYVVCTHDAAGCRSLQPQLLGDLQAKGVDTRVIMIARPDLNGQQRSTPAERATVAQLWIGRDWNLLTAWNAAAPGAWTAEGLPPADGSIAPTAVVESGRELVRRLTPLLRANRIRFAYPTLIWWNQAGEMRGCACDPRSYRFIRRELAG